MANLIGDKIECLSCKNAFVLMADCFVSEERHSNRGYAECPKCGTRNMITIKRNKEIKVRLTESEHQELLANKSGNELASWMREMCLGKKSKRRNPPPTVDPDLLRQLAAIGNNVNQLAKQVNAGQLGAGQAVQILVSLDAIEQQLSALRGGHAG